MQDSSMYSIIVRKSRGAGCFLAAGCWLLWLGCFASVQQAFAKEPLPYAPSTLELSRLPPFCAARYKKEPIAYKSWEQRFGQENWIHMHHYCDALNFMNRARFETDKRIRDHYLGVAVGNLNYVLARWNPNFQLSASARNLKLQADSMRSR